MQSIFIKCGVLAALILFGGQAFAQEAAQSQSYIERFNDVRTGLADWVGESGKDELTAIGMFMAADWVVKAVMISLAFASLSTWIIFISKVVTVRWKKAQLKRNFRHLDNHVTLSDARDTFENGRGVVGSMVRAALREVERTGQDRELKDGIKERVSLELSRIEAGASRSMMSGTGVLANVGSTAPFVGLFGTVWGIMNSFISISESNTTNLAVVAPGIAEALLATAVGLIAAIPAVIFYNLISRGLGGYKVMLADASALVERTLSRDLDVQTQPSENVILAEAAE